MLAIADLLTEALEKREGAGALGAVHHKVREITLRFPLLA